MTYAFTLDTSACTGCKACQEACKDKNGSPVGVLLRRVIEVTGGDWQDTGSAWENNVFAYYLSLACNHCIHPKCAGVCPTEAYTVRPDGIVLLDASRCMGCGYCAWACPYGAPQYDATLGIMTKCDFCSDNLDAGLLPTCVAACPLRVLNYEVVEELEAHQDNRNLWLLPGSEHPFPLPDFSRTEPSLSIKLHPAMNSPLVKLVSNQEEINPPQTSRPDYGISAFAELPLVAFTLLIQMSVGLAAWGLFLTPFPKTLLISIGLLLAAGGMTSFLHLGRKRNAWRAVTHLRKSWLSREVLMAGLFTLAWIRTAVWRWFGEVSITTWLMAILGLGLIYCMSRVYLLRAVPGWNSWRTPAAFFLSTTVLGLLAVRLVSPFPGSAFLAMAALAAEMALILGDQATLSVTLGKLRVALLGIAIVGILLSLSLPQFIGEWSALAVFIISLAAEVIGRWQFYALRKPFPMGLN